MPRSDRNSPSERERRRTFKPTTESSVAEAFIQLVSRAAAFGMGFDSDGIETQRDVEIVQDISLPPTTATDEAEPEGTAMEASPLPRSSSSFSPTVESGGEKDTSQAMNEDAAEPEQQEEAGIEDEQVESSQEDEELQEKEAIHQDTVMVSVMIEEEETIVEEIIERAPSSSSSSSSSPSSPASPADYSFEVSPPRGEMLDEDDDTVDTEMSEEVAQDMCSCEEIQEPMIRRDIRRGNQVDDEEEKEEAAEREHEPDLKEAADDEQLRGSDTLKEICERCGQELAEQEIRHHESECKVHQPEKVQENEGGNGGNDDELAVSADQNDNDNADAAVQDVAVSTTSEEAESRHQDEKDEPKNTPPGADDERPSDAEGGRAQVQEDGFRLFFDPSSSSDKPTEVECLDCGRVLVYRKSSMNRHAKSCPNRAGTSDQDEVMEATPPPVPKLKTVKRKLISIEDALTAADASPARANGEPDKAPSPQSPPAGATVAAALQTPRRSKRIRRDPTHSPMVEPIQETQTAEESARASSLPPSVVSPPPASPPRKSKKAVAPRKFKSPHADKINASATSSAVAMQRLYEAAGTLETGKVPIFSSKSVNEVRSLDHKTMRLWLFGTPENADKMKEHYHDSAQWIHSPCSRFQQLVHETLFGLDVVKLLDHLAPSATVTLLVDSKNSASSHRMGTATIVSRQEAQVMYDLGLSISFPAPESVDELIVCSLAHDLKASPLVNPRMHQARTFCCHAGFIFNWQFLRSDCFIIQLIGNTLWKTKRGSVRFPVRDYHPQSSTREEAESHLKAYVTGVRRKKTSALLPPVDDYHMEADQDDDESEIREVMLEPGSVVYMPAGTWFEAEVAKDAALLEVHIASVSPEEVVCGAVKQLVRADEQWRAPISGEVHDIKASRKRLGWLLKDLGTKISSLSPYDLLPEALLSTGDDPLTSQKATTDAEKCVDIDIRRHAFKGGKHIKVFKQSGFRENPLAVLMAMHEIPDFRSSEHHGSTTGGGSAATKSSNTLKKKALKKKLKRTAPVAARALKQSDAADEHAYVVHVQFGNSEFRSKLRVQFQCDAFQAAVVEWIRERAGTRFHLSEAVKFAHHQPGKPHNEEDATKYVLRFLSAIGFLSPVKMPPE